MFSPATPVLATHNWCDTLFNKTHERGSKMFSQAFGELLEREIRIFSFPYFKDPSYKSLGPLSASFWISQPLPRYIRTRVQWFLKLTMLLVVLDRRKISKIILEKTFSLFCGVSIGVCPIFRSVERSINELHRPRALFSIELFYKKYEVIYFWYVYVYSFSLKLVESF
jgi:hypothetical protein